MDKSREKDYTPRFENSAGLFGAGGDGTTNTIKCDWCGTIHKKEDYGSSNLNDEYNPDTYYIRFGPWTICECCFGDIEIEIVRLVPDLIPWLIRLIESREKKTSQLKDLLVELKIALSENTESPV